MPAKINFSPEIAQAILDDYDLGRGRGIKKIGREHGVAHNTIARFLRSRGAFIYGKTGRHNPRTAALRAEQKKRRSEIIRTRSRKLSDLPLFAARKIESTPEGRKRVRERFNRRYRTDIQFRLVHILRKRLNKVAKRGRGYSGDNLAWLGSQFAVGMTWDNLGSKRRHWSIDHIKPCASYRMDVVRERKECFHYTNLRPLWHVDNVRKGSWYGGVRHKHREVGSPRTGAALGGSNGADISVGTAVSALYADGG